MQIKALRAFVEVVRQGGFSQAAKVVFSTQSTVSKAVKQLEEELGLPLFDRSGYRNALTDAGQIVYRRALKILAERDDLIGELDALRGLSGGTLRLGLPRVGSSILFAPLFTTYRSRYPGIDIKLVEHGSERLEEILRAGDIDLAASLLPVPEEFDWQEVRVEPLVAVLPKAHPLANRASTEIAALRDIPFILFEAGFGLNKIILDACESRGFTPTIVTRSSQIDFILELAAAGVGVAFLPRLIVERANNVAAACLLLNEPETEWRMALIWRRGAFLPPAAQAWLDLTRETITSQAV
ncbi:MAG: LysR family transcriptional regulator [Methylovirgula sp.]